MEKSPDAFKTISEAAAALKLPQHVLRFWETRFKQVKPIKRGGGRRYYRPEDVSLLLGIRHLLYDQGFTIKGVQRILKEEGPRYAISIGEAGSLEAVSAGKTDAAGELSADQNSGVALAPISAPPPGLSASRKSKLNDVLRELLECKRQLDNARGN